MPAQPSRISSRSNLAGRGHSCPRVDRTNHVSRHLEAESLASPRTPTKSCNKTNNPHRGVLSVIAWFRQLSNPSPEGGPKVSLPCRAKRLGWLVLGRSMVNSAQQRSRIWRAAPALIFFLASIVVPTQAQAQTQTFKVLHTFHGKDGDAPVGQLVRDKAGNFYGTTTAGGTGKCQSGAGLPSR